MVALTAMSSSHPRVDPAGAVGSRAAAAAVSAMTVALVALIAVVGLAACDNQGGEGGAEDQSDDARRSGEQGVHENRVTTSEAARASAPRKAPAERNRPRTPDGYEIILPSASAKVENRSEEIIARAKKRREDLVLEPTRPDPEEGDFTLEEAIEGLPIEGELIVELQTDLGTLFCDLFADRAPKTVANFVGLVRGKRPFWDPEAGDWVTRPFYNRLTFHRVIPEFLIQTGDLIGDGEGGGGYTLEPESHETLRHDRAGRLVMANEEDQVSGVQFFILDEPRPELDSPPEGTHYNVFGQCRPESVVNRIARVPQTGGPLHRPLTDVQIWSARVRRVEGGAAQAKVTPPRPLPGMDPSVTPRGASPGPSELRARRQRLREGLGGDD